MLAEEAVAMTDGIDFWNVLASAHESLGDVYQLTGRADDAIRAWRQALDVCERKGAVPAAGHMRSKLDAVSR